MRCFPVSEGTRRTSSFSQRMPLGYFPRLQDSMRNKPCITSCPATRPKSLVPRAASEKNLSRPFQVASVRPFFLSGQASMQKCSDGEFESTSANAGWSTQAGSEGSMVLVNEFLFPTRVRLSKPPSVACRPVLSSRPSASFDCRYPKIVPMFRLRSCIRARIGATNAPMTESPSLWQQDSEKMLRPLAFLALFGKAALCLGSAVSVWPWNAARKRQCNEATVLRVFGVLMDTRDFPEVCDL